MNLSKSSSARLRTRGHRILSTGRLYSTSWRSTWTPNRLSSSNKIWLIVSNISIRLKNDPMKMRATSKTAHRPSSTVKKSWGRSIKWLRRKNLSPRTWISSILRGSSITSQLEKPLLKIAKMSRAYLVMITSRWFALCVWTSFTSVKRLFVDIISALGALMSTLSSKRRALYAIRLLGMPKARFYNHASLSMMS